jgi:uncharacterized integral membrane protein
MLFLILLAVVAVVVAVGALQNAQAVMVSFLFWQFEASLALVILWRARSTAPAPKSASLGARIER